MCWSFARQAVGLGDRKVLVLAQARGTPNVHASRSAAAHKNNVGMHHLARVRAIFIEEQAVCCSSLFSGRLLSRLLLGSWP